MTLSKLFQYTAAKILDSIANREVKMNERQRYLCCYVYMYRYVNDSNCDIYGIKLIHKGMSFLKDIIDGKPVKHLDYNCFKNELLNYREELRIKGDKASKFIDDHVLINGENTNPSIVHANFEKHEKEFNETSDIVLSIHVLDALLRSTTLNEEDLEFLNYGGGCVTSTLVELYKATDPWEASNIDQRDDIRFEELVELFRDLFISIRCKLNILTAPTLPNLEKA